MIEPRDTLIKRAKAYAAQNEEFGMDEFVMCYGDDEWAEFFDGDENSPPITTWEKARTIMDTVAAIRMDEEADARYHRNSSDSGDWLAQMVESEAREAQRRAMEQQVIDLYWAGGDPGPLLAQWLRDSRI